MTCLRRDPVVAALLIVSGAAACGDGAVTPTATAVVTEASLSGRVLSRADGAPIAGAGLEVHTTHGTKTATSDQEGAYLIAGLPAGTAEIHADAAGYSAATHVVQLATSQVIVNLQLTPASPPPPPTPPTTPPPLPPPPPTVVETLVRIIDVVTGRGLPGVVGEHDAVASTTSGADGSLRLSSASSMGAIAVRFTGDAMVSRHSYLRLPGEEARVTVIPSDFDLVALDQMARQPATKRWINVPPLVIEQRVLYFEDLNHRSWKPTPNVRDAAAVAELEADFIAALPELTGDVLQSFASITKTTTPEEAGVNVSVSDRISVFWVKGLAEQAGYDGFARWEFREWELTGGVILLDVDADDGPNRRWVRYHELGHTLGFTHVSARPSLMASSAQPITSFDRVVGRFVYSRPPGNRAPDVDPDGSSLNRVAARRWSDWIR